MRTDLFDFDLPSRLIALRPITPRDAARLLVIHADGQIEHSKFKYLSNFIRSGDVLALNDSRVIPARLAARRPARLPGMPDVAIEVTLHHREGLGCYSAFVQPAKMLRAGDVLRFDGGLTAQVVQREAGKVILAFNRDGGLLDQAIAEVGAIPLPPYIAKKRAPDNQDRIDYQTVYSRHDGSVAAPTAGLHFTTEMLEELKRVGIGQVPLTLHVGAGTFLPVAAENTDQHAMHAEHAILNTTAARDLNAARRAGGRIVAVGTTALRTLESAASENGEIQAFDADTTIFITPGYRFRAVDVLLTNFHLPKSTLFMLVCAFAGLDTMKRAYAEAIIREYRFYSYGDACLLFRPQ